MPLPRGFVPPCPAQAPDTSPGRAALPIFTNNDSKPDAGTTLAILATLTQFQHAITQFASYPWSYVASYFTYRDGTSSSSPGLPGCEVLSKLMCVSLLVERTSLDG